MKNVALPVFAGFSLFIVGGIITNSIIGGEQLVIKFLVTVVVATLGLYIISDLRLRQSGNSAILSNQSSAIQSSQQTESGPTNMPIFRSKVAKEPTISAPPSNSTAAFMADMNKTKGRQDAAISNDRSYSAMSRINQKRRQRSPEAEQPSTAPVAPTTSPSKPNEISSDETTLNAAPLETRRTQKPIEELSPSRADTADTIAPGEFPAVIELGVDHTSVLSLPSDVEVDDTNFDESVTWILVDDPTEDGNEPQNLDEDSSLVEMEIDEPDEIGISDEDVTATNTPDADVVEAVSLERRRFAPEDINIGHLRSVNLETPATSSSAAAGHATANGNATLSESHTSPLSTINSAIADGEQTIISSLIEQGVLSSDGPITDNDVTTMVYVAFTSSELRKILQDGGSMDTNSGEISLEGLGIYTSDELEADDQFLVVGPNETVNELETKAGI